MRPAARTYADEPYCVQAVLQCEVVVDQASHDVRGLLPHNAHVGLQAQRAAAALVAQPAVSGGAQVSVSAGVSYNCQLDVS